MQEYDVKRDHYGDKQYRTGDVRKAAPASVVHLVERGVLVLRQAKKTKAEKPLKNKSK